MKLLLKKIFLSKLAILFRNSIKYRPVYLKHFEKDYPTCVSDAFLWRTDSGYQTKFKYSDILSLFYKLKNTRVEIHFYNKYNQLIKVEKVNDLNSSNEFTITSGYLGNINDFGTFFIYHFMDNQDDSIKNDIISNRCYLGYSKDHSLHSFVHGNALAKFTGIYPRTETQTDIVKTSLFQNHSYTIQKYFSDFDKNELFFVNPTSKITTLTIEKKKFKLNPNCVLLLETKSNIVSYKSNCMFLRPTIFSYKGQYVDVHHS